ncbi:hypothetical protein LEP1GSC172_1721 [Leptospira noguchii]|uniref:Uncharacterized protein n=1 Tax=Leptospira noguchii TaxID=28182 RepID=M6VEX4_9LEPT|nr:hypothetical protein LEP1GSC172_1721 [Leptospira noguchii]
MGTLTNLDFTDCLQKCGNSHKFRFYRLSSKMWELLQNHSFSMKSD